MVSKVMFSQGPRVRRWAPRARVYITNLCHAGICLLFGSVPWLARVHLVERSEALPLESTPKAEARLMLRACERRLALLPSRKCSRYLNSPKRCESFTIQLRWDSFFTPPRKGARVWRSRRRSDKGP